MVQITEVLSLNNPTFRAYLFYSSILIVKVMLMAPLTAIQRFKNKAFINPEDTVGMKVKVRVDDKVERVRRAHLNDLENVLLFFVIGFIYVLTSPAPGMANMLFRIFTLARIIHTIVYAVVIIPQPARFLAFIVAYAINGYMAYQSITTFMST